MEHIRKFIVSIGFLLFCFSFIPTIFAEEGDTYEVSIAALNARNAPSHSSDVVGMLSQGDQIVSFQEKHGWLMTYYGGQEVWIAAQFLAPVTGEEASPEDKEQASAEDAQAQQGTTIQVDADHARIRSGAGTDYSAIGTAQAGDTYQIAETSGDWHKISLDDDSSGWIASWLTDSPTSAQEDEDAAENTEKETVTLKEADNEENPDGSLDGKTIVLDPGHGGKDPGSLGLDGVKEKDVIMSVTDEIASQLQNAGANVVLTRTGDYFLSLEERVEASHKNDADAFVSLHYNAFPVIGVQGMNTYYYSNGANHELADSIHGSLAKNMELTDRGVSEGDFQVLRENSNPAVLLELGFITNPDDLLHIQSSAYKDNVANGITDGLKDYLN